VGSAGEYERPSRLHAYAAGLLPRNWSCSKHLPLLPACMCLHWCAAFTIFVAVLLFCLLSLVGLQLLATLAALLKLSLGPHEILSHGFLQMRY
jgi:hypothetical protein